MHIIEAELWWVHATSQKEVVIFGSQPSMQKLASYRYKLVGF